MLFEYSPTSPKRATPTPIRDRIMHAVLRYIIEALRNGFSLKLNIEQGPDHSEIVRSRYVKRAGLSSQRLSCDGNMRDAGVEATCMLTSFKIHIETNKTDGPYGKQNSDVI